MHATSVHLVKTFRQIFFCAAKEQHLLQLSCKTLGDPPAAVSHFKEQC
jgi:hypothetical protein